MSRGTYLTFGDIADKLHTLRPPVPTTSAGIWKIPPISDPCFCERRPPVTISDARFTSKKWPR